MNAPRLIATWFGSGLSPFAPGTVGTAATVPVYLLLWFAGAPHWSVAVAAVLTMAIGIPTAGIVARQRGLHDPGEVVIDEVTGYLAACSLTPFGWTTAIAAFALFRLLDIWKPWPIRALERLPGGWGIVMDDVAAGWLSAGILWLAWRI